MIVEIEQSTGADDGVVCDEPKLSIGMAAPWQSTMPSSRLRELAA